MPLAIAATEAVSTAHMVVRVEVVQSCVISAPSLRVEGAGRVQSVHSARCAGSSDPPPVVTVRRDGVVVFEF